MIECVPVLRALVAKVARPEARVTVPSTVDPSRNWTVPAGVPLEAVTAAVNVTDWPAGTGFADDVSAVVVAVVVELTTSDTTVEVEAEKPSDPP